MQTYSFSLENLIGFGVTGIKIFIIIMMGIYLIYALTLSRRLKIMNQNLETPYKKNFIRLSRLHIIASIATIIITVLSI
ncbi:MAG TPA: hypothetical protein PKH50_01530 [bacterium]|jgi:hypothetical protein|nr:hypothetical protein [bacterium]